MNLCRVVQAITLVNTLSAVRVKLVVCCAEVKAHKCEDAPSGSYLAD